METRTIMITNFSCLLNFYHQVRFSCRSPKNPKIGNQNLEPSVNNGEFQSFPPKSISIQYENFKFQPQKTTPNKISTFQIHFQRFQPFGVLKFLPIRRISGCNGEEECESENPKIYIKVLLIYLKSSEVHHLRRCNLSRNFSLPPAVQLSTSREDDGDEMVEIGGSSTKHPSSFSNQTTTTPTDFQATTILSSPHLHLRRPTTNQQPVNKTHSFDFLQTHIPNSVYPPPRNPNSDRPEEINNDELELQDPVISTIF
ncbi:hypothetical protein H5410_004103 [Solanum commersonii]|uniref:Uncharacterized protein n=1 Tax=Solanum commersonii TaxID=4109 RepID=A0A9J6B706_SOLCO|nr:hypothetical protein H5410_004103 [Solanum commersonii]